MRILTMLLAFFILVTTTFAYESGAEFCAKNPIGERGESRLHRVSEKQMVHSYTLKAFNRLHPTVLFFTGGPGSSPRSSEFDLEGINVIFFEQRGMGCSRADDVQTFLNPKNYSSELSVSDAAIVLRSYGIDQVVVYGHSYGTVLATMFAHRHPDLVSKVILEGVIFRGDLSIWKSEIRRANLQKVFDSLEIDLQERILSLSKKGILPVQWFSVVGSMMMYLDNGGSVYKNFLENILQMEDTALQSFIGNFFSARGFLTVSPEESSDGEVTFGMITCQELSGRNPEASFNLIFDETKKLIWKNDNSVEASYCRPLGIESETGFVDLEKFSLQVPVIYLVGEDDGATDRLGALNHRSSVAGGKGEFYLLKGGGHLPNLGPLKDLDRAQKAFFRALVLGEEVPLPTPDWMML